MNKQLLLALVAATFSGITFATEAPAYSAFPLAQQEYCTAYNTNICQKLEHIFTTINITLESRKIENGDIVLSEEEKTEIAALSKVLYEEMQEYNALKQNLLKSAEQKIEEVGKEIAEELNIADSKE